MKTIVFTGMDETDLNQQQWAWQTSGTKKIFVKQWPDELLPLTARTPIPMSKMLPVEGHSRKVDYEEE